MAGSNVTGSMTGSSPASHQVSCGVSSQVINCNLAFLYESIDTMDYFLGDFLCQFIFKFARMGARELVRDTPLFQEVPYVDPGLDFPRVLLRSLPGARLLAAVDRYHGYLSLIHISEPTRLGMISYA